MKQIRQREGRERGVKLERGLAGEDGPPQYAHKINKGASPILEVDHAILGQ